MNAVVEVRPAQEKRSTARKVKVYSKVSYLAKDRRIMLKIKLANLVQESRLIRQREHTAWRYRDTDLGTELNLHRTGIVRRAARETGLALGFIRGRAYEQMEPTAQTQPNWTTVLGMVKKYGEPGQWKPLAEKHAPALLKLKGWV